MIKEKQIETERINLDKKAHAEALKEKVDSEFIESKKMERSELRRQEIERFDDEARRQHENSVNMRSL